ncbi:MAG: hypothetical protein LBH30_03050 [Prevotellaceae bacterium]|jgi:predicted helicase|nr:hypothetical protein [Prevotellaceae bacterium]
MTNSNDKKTARIFHFDLYGKREEKYSFLNENRLSSIDWQELQPAAPNYFFVPKDLSLQEEYEKGFKVDELFTIYVNGIVTGNDEQFIRFEKFQYDDKKILYRPFDVRYIDYDLSKIQRSRYDVMQNYLQNDGNVGLIVSKQFGGHKHFICFITNVMNEKSSQPFAPYYNFPLYLYQEHFGITEKITNMKEAIVEKIATNTGVKKVNEIQIFDYIYAVLHSQSYRERYKEFLQIDFPRIPYPENAEQFKRLADFGKKLRKLHLMENVELSKDMANFPVSGASEIEKLEYTDNKVFINNVQYFDNIPQVAWKFYIGGYQPAQKWLKDRKGRKLDFDDIVHYQKIITVLCKTEQIMKEIDINLI